MTGVAGDAGAQFVPIDFLPDDVRDLNVKLFSPVLDDRPAPDSPIVKLCGLRVGFAARTLFRFVSLVRSRLGRFSLPMCYTQEDLPFRLIYIKSTPVTCLIEAATDDR